ncbi:MAG: hypothetical protein IPJ43_21380 [Saprospiraceae bacterium]|nr:hypothetical protein [Saprospiraceae bacterium]
MADWIIASHTFSICSFIVLLTAKIYRAGILMYGKNELKRNMEMGVESVIGI